MRRIKYKDEEYLVHTRSGMRLIDALVEQGVPVTCDCDGQSHTTEQCLVQWPKDTAFLLTEPTEFERRQLGDRLEKGHRLACQALFK